MFNVCPEEKLKDGGSLFVPTEEEVIVRGEAHITSDFVDSCRGGTRSNEETRYQEKKISTMGIPCNFMPISAFSSEISTHNSSVYQGKSEGCIWVSQC